MTLTYYVEWLFNILEDYFTTLFEASDLDFDYFTNATFIVSEILDTLVILDDTRDSEIKATKDDTLLDIFDEGKDIRVNIESADIRYVSVYESVSNTFSGVT